MKFFFNDPTVGTKQRGGPGAGQAGHWVAIPCQTFPGCHSPRDVTGAET